MFALILSISDMIDSLNNVPRSGWVFLELNKLALGKEITDCEG
jgi:hypothetical protein